MAEHPFYILFPGSIDKIRGEHRPPAIPILLIEAAKISRLQLLYLLDRDKFVDRGQLRVLGRAGRRDGDHERCQSESGKPRRDGMLSQKNLAVMKSSHTSSHLKWPLGRRLPPRLPGMN